jgi:oligopeptide transport system substrate-binding protein
MGRVLIIPLGLLGLLLAAMAWSGGGVEDRADFTFFNRGDIYTLDINQMSYMQDLRMTYAIREGLYSLDPETFRPIPAGASGYEISDDKHAWTFHLRPECRWSNGDKVTAADYIFSWRRMLEDPGAYSYLLYYMKNAEKYEKSYAEHNPIPFDTVGMKAVDDLTLRVELDNPVPYLLDLVAFPPFYPRNQRSMEKFKVVEADPDHKFQPSQLHYSYEAQYTRPPGLVTNGPFEMTRWDFHRRILLKKSEHYWNKAAVGLNSIEMLVNENILGQFLDYETGRVDWVSEVLGDLGAELMAKGRKDLDVSPAFGTAFLILLCSDKLPPDLGGGKNPLADVKVRQALAMAIDKEFIVRNVTRMGELPATTYVPPDGTLVGYTWAPGPHVKDQTRRYTAEECRKLLREGHPGPGLAYDPARARELLAEAGYPGGQGFPVLPIFYNTDSPVRGKMCEVLRNQWKQQLGIQVDIQGKEGKVYKDVTNKHQYAIGIAAWYGDYPDASTFSDKYLSSSLNNESAWFNPTYDDLCARAAKEPDAEKHLRMLEDAETMINTQAPIVPLYHYVNGSLTKPWVKGLKENPRNLQVFTAIRVERHRGS